MHLCLTAELRVIYNDYVTLNNSDDDGVGKLKIYIVRQLGNEIILETYYFALSYENNTNKTNQSL